MIRLLLLLGLFAAAGNGWAFQQGQGFAQKAQQDFERVDSAPIPSIQDALACSQSHQALLAADQEFAQNLAKTAREVAGKRNLPVVFDQAYPPNTVEFSSIMRALKATKPDIVYVASYPPDSVGITFGKPA